MPTSFTACFFVGRATDIRCPSGELAELAVRFDHRVHFQPEKVEILNDDLSVNTAEEFLHFSSRYKDEVPSR